MLGDGVGYLAWRMTGYSILQNIVSEGLAIERNRINTILNKELNPDEKKLIISLILVKDGISTLAELHQDAKNFGFKMMSEERRKHRILEELYEVAQKATSKLEISQQNIKYYGNLAIHYNARDLSKLKYNQAYLYVLCYIYIKYQEEITIYLKTLLTTLLKQLIRRKRKNLFIKN